MPSAGILRAILDVASAGGANLATWGAAWARLAPTIVLVPAFGLGILPVALRVAFALALGAALAPALAPVLGSGTGQGPSWPLVVGAELARGLPVAISASVSLWAATVAGGVVDTALGLRARPGAALARTGTPIATLLGLVGAIGFLEGGGAAWVVERLGAAYPGPSPLLRAALDLAAGVGIGAAIGAPVLAVALVVDMTTLVATREFPPLRGGTWLAPARTLVVLVATAALLDRVAEAVVLLGPGNR